MVLRLSDAAVRGSVIEAGWYASECNSIHSYCASLPAVLVYGWMFPGGRIRYATSELFFAGYFLQDIALAAHTHGDTARDLAAANGAFSARILRIAG